MQGGICDNTGLVLYSLFLLGNNYYHPDTIILKNMVMGRTDNYINYIFRPEKAIGMLMGEINCVNYRYACFVIVQ